MNLLEAEVIEVLSEPYFKHDKWWVTVNYDCYDLKSKTELMFNTEEEAKKVEVGFKFLT